MGACALERVLNWLKTVIRTSPMTSQITRFLTRLFKVASSGARGDSTARRLRDFTPNAPAEGQGNLSQNPDARHRIRRPRARMYISRERLREAPGFREATRSNPDRTRASSGGKPLPWKALTSRLPPGARWVSAKSTASSQRWVLRA